MGLRGEFASAYLKRVNIEAVPESQGNGEPNLAIQYSEYAPQYDSMCELIPAYQENIQHLLDLIPYLDLPDNPRICDLGAGTGNYVCALADVLPQATFVHVDVNPAMNNRAVQKYQERAINNVEVYEEYIQRIEFVPESFDLILCVNALNTAPPQLQVLRKVRSWLRKDGTLFLIDFGREQRVLDWGWYILSNTIRTYGVRRYIRALFENREAIRQNRKAAADQKSGAMWVHSPSEFQSVVERAGFKVEKADVCYRSYCDRVVAKLV